MTALLRDHYDSEGSERTMKIFAVDDEPKALRELSQAIAEAAPDADIREFERPADVIATVDAGEVPDVLFADVNMPYMNGVELAKALKLRCPRLNVIFATGYVEYMRDALNLHVSGYLQKPIMVEDVRVELDNLRHPVRPSPHRVRFRCFGNFEVYIDGQPVIFHRKKTKEYLAYLVDRETLCTGAEIAATLWDGNVSTSYLRALRKELNDTFTASGCADVLINAWQQRGIRTDLVDCDYYDWKKGKPWAINAYRGEYMTQYHWAELTHGSLENPVK